MILIKNKDGSYSLVTQTFGLVEHLNLSDVSNMASFEGVPQGELGLAIKSLIDSGKNVATFGVLGRFICCLE
jgi:hypothetical protein